MEPFFMELPRARVRVQVTGDGARTLVIIPDPPNLIEHHREVIEQLARGFRVICFELPGFGRSELRNGARFSLELQVEIMTEVLERLSARQVVLEMSCLGALAGMRLARLRPDLVERLVLAQVSTQEQMRTWARGTDICGLIHTPRVGQALVSLCRRFIARHWYTAALPEGTDARTRQRYLQPTLQSLREGGPFELASAYQALRRSETLEYGAIQQPTLLLWGRADRTHEDTSPRALLHALPHAELMEFEGCGHFPTLEKAGAYVERLRTWAGGLPG
ncbi:alpha/beta fold hydrolase [Hyalangium rubrum]|uniref:Alpha/beta hydrolase n=1 Tax=Hyalangium rubrum TaxID=3103134 RepID=A0ABU5H1G6_9BACT|nr:alpha/beta hydrolase [Hyalangium sp. s54d21]MDY7227235.1 alpha/beta hydrolase [Hyalangium sp. s54d21]